jgi:hypothetical protein
LIHVKSWSRFVAAVILAFASNAHAQELVGVNPFNNTSSSPGNFGLFHVDRTTGAITDGRVITIPSRTITGANSITTDPATGKVYAIVKASTGERLLVTLDVATGAGSEIGILGGNFSSIAFRSDGQLFGLTGNGASPSRTLFLIDKASAAQVLATTLGGTCCGEVIAYHPGDDAFYRWSGSDFERVSARAPYAATPILSGPGREVFGAVWDPARSAFLVHDNTARMDYETTAGVRSGLQAPTLTVVRGMALVVPTANSIVRASPNPSGAAAVNFTVTFSDAVSGVDASDFAVIAGGTATGTISSVVGSGTTWTVTVGSITGDGTLRLDLVDDDSITNGTNALGGAGAANGNFATGEVYNIDRVAPAVASVAVPANGTYTAGQALQFTVSWGETVTVNIVGGAPSLPLTIGSTTRNAAYVSGSGSSSLVFAYTVQLGDVDSDGVGLSAAISLNGATIQDAIANNAVLALNGVASTTGVLVAAPFVFTVTQSAGANGTIAPNAPQIVTSGGTTVFTLTPAGGYAASVGGTCGGALAGNTYTTNAITANCTVSATFTQITYTVTPSAGANGSIASNAPQTIASGATTVFTVTPSAGYTASVGGTCGGALVGNTYTTNAITANCSVSATFTQITYTVTPSAGANGTITPATAQTIGSGATTAFTVTPSAGYTASVGGTCGGALVGNTYTTNAITANCTVAATFTQVTYTVTPSAGANGSITPATAQTIGSGATTAFTITPSAGYSASAGGTCGGALVGNTYTTNAITANCTVAATFTQVTYTVTPSAGANGSITPATAQTIGSGATTTFTVAPSAGYAASVGGTCGGALAGTTYTTNAITANCTVAASFVATAITTYTAPSATGSGTITASFTGGGPACTYATSQFIPLVGHANSPPAGSAPSGIAFPNGLFDFTLSGCTPGATIVMTITYPAALPSDTQYWKYGPMPGSLAAQWYVLPATIAGTTATFSITDGKLGDDDLTANGTIVDQGGPGIGSQPVRQVPTLSQWALLLIAALMMASGITMANRRIGK